MSKIPDELVQAIQAGECVLWTGAGIGALAGLPGWGEILAAWVRRCPEAEHEGLAALLAQGRLRPVLGYVLRHLGESALQLDDTSAEAPLRPGAELVGKMRWRACLATAYTEVLRRALAAEGQEVDVLGHREIHRPTLRPGARDDERPLILKTPPAGRALRADRALFEVVEEIVRTRTILFLGFDVDDPDLAEILGLLTRVGRGRRHFAAIPFVSAAEAEELLEDHGIAVFDPCGPGAARGAAGDPVAVLAALHEAIWEVRPRVSSCRADFAALDLRRHLADLPLRIDLAVDAALTLGAEEASLLLAQLGPEEEGRIDVATRIRLGNLMAAHGRLHDARRHLQAALDRRPGREYQALARHGLARLAAFGGLSRVAVEGLREAATIDRSLALWPSRLPPSAVRAADAVGLRLTCEDGEGGAEVEVCVRSLPRALGLHGQRRFTAEVERLAGLRSPHLQRLRGGFTDGELFGTIAEPAAGPTLAEALAEAGTLETFRALRMAMAVLDGLAALHGEGLLHRDVRPETVTLAEGGATLGGLGFATITNLRRPAQRLCSDGYVAPELLAGEPASAASDVYAAAGLLYRALCGRAPQPAAPPLAIQRPDLDPRLPELLARALHPDPGQRISPRRLRSELAGVVSVPMVLVSRLGAGTLPAPGGRANLGA